MVDGVINLVGGPWLVGDADRTFTMRAIARSTTTAGKMEAGVSLAVYMWVVELERRERRTWTFPGNGYRIWE
jgi:hypothetical protein